MKQFEAYINRVDIQQAIFLKLNEDKTEFMILGKKNSLSKIGNIEMKVANHEVSLSKYVRNIGVLYKWTTTYDI